MRDITDEELAAVFPLVERIIWTMRKKGSIIAAVEDDDLVAVGRAAAWQALARVEAGRDRREVDTYVWGRIVGGIIDYQRAATRALGFTRKDGSIAHVDHLDDPVSDSLTVTIGETLADQADVALSAELHARLERANRIAATLKGRRRAVAEWILAGEPVTGRQLADQIGVSESRVCQIAAEVRRLFVHGPMVDEGVLLVDRNAHPTEHDARLECGRVRPGAEVIALYKRKVRSGRVVSPQGRPNAAGGLGRPVWAIELREAA